MGLTNMHVPLHRTPSHRFPRLETVFTEFHRLLSWTVETAKCDCLQNCYLLYVEERGGHKFSSSLRKRLRKLKLRCGRNLRNDEAWRKNPQIHGQPNCWGKQLFCRWIKLLLPLLLPGEKSESLFGHTSPVVEVRVVFNWRLISKNSDMLWESKSRPRSAVTLSGLRETGKGCQKRRYGNVHKMDYLSRYWKGWFLY